MTGGLIQLVAEGKQDIILTKDPEITFFKIVYKRYTNFSMESVVQKFSHKLDFGGKASCILSKVGDLVGNITLVAVLPKIPSYTNNNEGADKFKYFAWVKKVGFALIKSIFIDIGGQKIDEQYGDWMNIWNELTGSKKKAFDYLIGNTKDLTDYSDGKEMRTLYIPIKFWFCGNSGMALPLVNLLYSKVKITVELNNASNVYLTTPSHYIGVNNDIVNLKQFEYIEQTVNNTKSIGIYIGHDIYEKKLYYIKVSGENFKGIPQDSNNNINTIISNLESSDSNEYKIIGIDSNYEVYPGANETPISIPKYINKITLKDCYLLVDYLYIDTSERKKFALSTHEYVIDYIKFNGIKEITSSNSVIQLVLNNPCSEIFWTAQFKYLNDNRFINYGSSYKDHFNYTDDYKYDSNNNFLGKNNIISSKLLLNGNDRFEKRTGDYFNLIQSYQYHKNGASTGINSYSFSLFPEDNQSSGLCNMSMIDQISLELTLNNNISYKNPAIIRIYSRHKNILKIENGLGALEFVP